MSRTAIVWIDGNRYVFRGEEIDTILEIGAEAESIPEAWDSLIEYAERRGD